MSLLSDMFLRFERKNNICFHEVGASALFFFFSTLSLVEIIGKGEALFEVCVALKRSLLSFPSC